MSCWSNQVQCWPIRFVASLPSLYDCGDWMGCWVPDIVFSLSHTHTHTHTHMYTYTHNHAHTCMHTHTHRNTHPLVVGGAWGCHDMCPPLVTPCDSCGGDKHSLFFSSIYVQISSTDVRVLVDMPGKLLSIGSGEMQEYLANTMCPQLAEEIQVGVLGDFKGTWRVVVADGRILCWCVVGFPCACTLFCHFFSLVLLQPFFLDAVKSGRIRAVPNREMPSGPSYARGAILLGDAFNCRHPLTGGCTFLKWPLFFMDLATL